MKNKKFKIVAILSTILLALSVLVSSINAVTPNGIQSQSSSSAKFVGTENSNSEISYVENTSSKLSNPVPSVSSSQGKAMTIASSKSSSPVVSTSNDDSEDNPFVGNDSMVDENSTSEGYIGKYQVTPHPQYGNNVYGLTEGNGLYPHFDVNDDIGKCYCYEWNIPAPDQPGTNYNGYKFYDGMKVAANKQKAAEVASALMAGYHLDKTTNQWQMAVAFQAEAQKGYNLLEQQYNSNDYQPDPGNSGNLNGAELQLSPNYSLEDYERDVTQSVIWKISGATDSSADLANKTPLGRDLYAYAMAHPLDEQTAYSDNLKAVSQGTQLSANHPLTIDPTTLKSQTFSITGYDGLVGIQNIDPNVQVIDSETGKAVSGLTSGHTYYLQAKELNTANKKNYFDLSYENLAESHYLSVEDLNAPSMEDNNKYQNMVDLATKSLNLPINFVYQQSSSSLSVASSKSEANSSIVKSSLVVSSKASSKKPSSVASSSKVSSKKSSSVVSSSKISSSENLNQKSSVVLNLFVSHSNVTSSTVKFSSSHHRHHRRQSSKELSSVVSQSSKTAVVSSSKSLSSKESSSKTFSSVASQTVKSSSFTHHRHHRHHRHQSSKELSSVVSQSSKTSVVSSSNQSIQALNSRAQSSSICSQKKIQSESSEKQAVVMGTKSSNQKNSGSQHGKGEGHGMPQTGEAATALVTIGMILLVMAGAVELRKNK